MRTDFTVSDIFGLAAAYAKWCMRATWSHTLLSELALKDWPEEIKADGTVVVTLPAAVWAMAKEDAREPLPEPLVQA